MFNRFNLTVGPTFATSLEKVRSDWPLPFVGHPWSLPHTCNSATKPVDCGRISCRCRQNVENSLPHLAAEIRAAVNHVRSIWTPPPRAGIILGSGLSGLAAAIEKQATIPYTAIPHFPTSTVMGHAGALVCGHVDGLPVVAMQGRFHLYEGHTAAQITLPIRVMKGLGIELLILSNASGGLNPQYEAGNLVVIDDHINLMFRNPLIGINDEQLGPRFPDMSRPYERVWIERVLQIARRRNITAHRGVYAAMSGPTYETRAEYRMLRRLGADVVGMSTVPETTVAVHTGIPVLALSIVANVCKPDLLEKTSGSEVVRAAQNAEPKLRQIVLDVLGLLAAESTS